jgi:hypothetical protein
VSRAFTERHEVEAINAVELGDNHMGGRVAAWRVVLGVGGAPQIPTIGKAEPGASPTCSAQYQMTPKVPPRRWGSAASAGLVATFDAANLSGNRKDPSKIRRVDRGGESWV